MPTDGQRETRSASLQDAVVVSEGLLRRSLAQSRAASVPISIELSRHPLEMLGVRDVVASAAGDARRRPPSGEVEDFV